VTKCFTTQIACFFFHTHAQAMEKSVRERWRGGRTCVCKCV